MVQTGWIDINKEDDEMPNYRSTLVGNEFNKEPMEGLFAGTPPLEALRYLIHEAATVRSGEALGPKVIMINDVARAFFEALADPKQTSGTIMWDISGCAYTAQETQP